MEAQDDCCNKWRQIPAFGDWNLWDDDLPVAQYFEPGTFFFTAQAGEDDVDLFKVPHFAATPYSYSKCVIRVKGEEKADLAAAPARKKKGGGRKKQQQQQRANEQQQRRKPKVAAAVDEDLYKISPNVICKVQKKKLLRNLLGGCLGLNCIA
ncbi:uncharacterized protein LOC100835004 [Brachypodium distachyon]|uniref:Uncharacterized protein n=1 Tax=Brachypodium distachyon TaxID=15368 RepID=I1HUH9_BRADI|nr:uncharacterized protein LOC100835004 [Brachypodium distachyon]KQK11164.1 hypothetical protein BRADI_2g58507v3 [Brachypodium distachyon]|eukprot:XP_003564902.1 uncharacterized protein LOC100835004 [Brachypodium distachyon]